MWEFVLNSRHPSLRREVGGLRAAGHMPLPRDPGDPRDPGENSGRLYFVRRLRRYSPFARNWTSTFQDLVRRLRRYSPLARNMKSKIQDLVRRLRRYSPLARTWMSNFQQCPQDTPRHPHGSQVHPKGSQMDHQVVPRGVNVSQGASQSDPNGPQSCHK